jgi:hypothetical protein
MAFMLIGSSLCALRDVTVAVMYVLSVILCLFTDYCGIACKIGLMYVCYIGQLSYVLCVICNKGLIVL